MKLKISVKDIPYSGYVNIDPKPIINEDTKHIEVNHPEEKLAIEDATCEEIVIHNYLEKLNADSVYAVIANWVKKLRHSGTIKIIGTNLDTVVRSYLNGQINNLDFNKKLFGEQGNTWDSNSLMMNYMDVVDILVDCGLKIRSKELLGDKYVIVAYRV
jgi:predicted SAM-dependent methyltransferase